MNWNTLYFFVMYFFVYAFFGRCVEVAYAGRIKHRFVNRGFLNGPICPVYGFGVTLVLSLLTPLAAHLLPLYLASILLVTTLEWLTGFILEKVFHNKWWDYSNMRFNLNGYVCLQMSLVWGVCCVLIVRFIHPVIHRLLAHLPMWLGIALITIFSASAFADLYVTASGILKLNRHLEKMQEIADELHRLSDRIGENIYETTARAIELQEDFAEKREELQSVLEERQADFSDSVSHTSEEIRERIEELRTRYTNMASTTSRLQKRLLKAFPAMKSRLHKEALEDIREKLRELDKSLRKK